MASAVVKFSVLLLLVSLCTASIDQQCLKCMCKAMSGCTNTCQGDGCGVYRISWPYWADAGKPVLPGDSPDQPDAYRKCALNEQCATEAVANYMDIFSQDCNGDGKIDCDDFIAIHKLGPYACSGNVPIFFLNAYKNCVNQQG